MAARRPPGPALFETDRPRSRRIGRVRRGWDVTVRALRATRRIEPIDEALIALGRVCADEADLACADVEQSPFVRNALLKTMLATVVTLRDQTRADVDSADLDDVLARLVDAETRSPD